jgi:hypothetical protein
MRTLPWSGPEAGTSDLCNLVAIIRSRVQIRKLNSKQTKFSTAEP